MPDDKKKPEKKRRRCSVCRCLKYDVEVTDDPYNSDLYDKSIKIKVCSECYNILVQDI